MFLCEKQIFNNNFFETAKGIMDVVLAKVPETLS